VTSQTRQATRDGTRNSLKSNGLVRTGKYGTETIFGFTKAYQATYPVFTMSRVLKASASGFYAWMRRSPSEHAKSDVLLGDRIEAISRRSRSTYGRPRIHAELVDGGIRISGKRVARLMRNRSISAALRVEKRRLQRPAIVTQSRRRISSSVALRPTLPINCGSPTSRTFRRGAVFYTLPWFSTSIAVASLAGRWLTICAKSSLSERSTWPSFDASRSRLFITPIKVLNTRPSPSRNVSSLQAFVLRWILVVTATTMRCMKDSTPRSNASYALSTDSVRNVKRSRGVAAT
jgi:hypothetical protein